MIIDGRELARKYNLETKQMVQALSFRPRLAVILIGDHWESRLYIEQKKKVCEELGIDFALYDFSKDVEESLLLDRIAELNQDKTTHGIIVQLPIPVPLNLLKIQEKIDPWKDVDGFNPINRGLLFSVKNGIFPQMMVSPTPLACLNLIRSVERDLSGKKVVVVGRSNIVGKPLSLLLQSYDATVTLCHSHTLNLKNETQQADILVVATGQPRLINVDMVKTGAIVIDVGINRLGEKLVGDVDFETAKNKASFITPVPGGVGPMTVAMLIQNTVKAAQI